jgi:BirA family biotin operon repressor/biotin-[acetyl-CoA-carboxylase] ligase
MIDHREIEILRTLLQSEKGVALTGLAEQTGCEPGEIDSTIDSLERDGFAFDRADGIIRLVSEPEALRPQSIQARLVTNTIGREVHVFRETTSTNDLVRRAGIGGAAEGVVFFAEQQTAGRGTRGRKWVSAGGQGLWFSILLRSTLPMDQWPLLVQMAAVGVAEVAEKWIDRPVSIKPPNDLIVGGGKMAGLLLETSNAVDFQILGIGINVKSAPQIDGYATSALEQFSSSPIRLNEFAAAILTNFESWYLKWPLEQLAVAIGRRMTDEK